MTSFRRARAAGSRTKRRRSLILTSLSKTVSAAAFTSATNPCWSRAIAGRRIALSAAVGEETDPCAPATAAISIKRRVKEERIRSSSARRLPASEFISKKFILTPGSLLKYFNDRCGPGIENSDCQRAYQNQPGRPAGETRVFG